jgi:hypothetical protein
MAVVEGKMSDPNAAASRKGPIEFVKRWWAFVSRPTTKLSLGALFIAGAVSGLQLGDGIDQFDGVLHFVSRNAGHRLSGAQIDNSFQKQKWRHRDLLGLSCAARMVLQNAAENSGIKRGSS